MRSAPPPQRSTLGGTFGVIALALGVGIVGAYVLDFHGHTCGCGHRWHHLGAFNVGDEAAHTCSRCGSTQWWKNGALKHGHGGADPFIDAVYRDIPTERSI